MELMDSKDIQILGGVNKMGLFGKEFWWVIGE